MKRLFLLAAASILLLSGCADRKPAKIDYRQAEGYFVRNDVENGTILEKITTDEAFDRYFGTAATMTARPTEIDFSRSYVGAIILPLTDWTTDIRIDSVTWNGDKAHLYYSTLIGKSHCYSTRPFAAVIIDRDYDGEMEITHNASADRPDTHNSRNALDYAGTYTGTIPCADCPGIDIVLTLDSSGNYTKTMTYQDREPDNVFTTSGKYEWDRDGSRIRLLDEKEREMYKVAENRLLYLNVDGNVITGDLEEFYILKKQ